MTTQEKCPELYLLDDLPIQHRELIPNLQAMVERIYPILNRPENKDPVLLSGYWGSGKTSVLHALENKVDKGSKKKRTIFFEAWHYEGSAGLLPGLIRCVWEAGQKLPVQKKKPNKEVYWKVLKSAIAISSNFASLYAKAQGFSTLAEMAKSAIGIFALAEDIKQEQEKKRKPAIPEDEVSSLRKNFKKLLGFWEESEPPVILIDDLDRCSPEGAVGLLDAIRLLVADRELACKFVVALDRTVVVQAISNKFAGIRGYDGNRYLEKVFPLCFFVPTADTETARRIVGELQSKVLENNRGSLLEADWDAVAATLIQPHFSNPRLMKRCINYYLMIHYFRNQCQADTVPKVPDKALCSWIAGTQRWPRLRDLIQRRDQRYWNEFLECLDSPNDAKRPGPEAEALLHEPGLLNWLRGERGMGDDPRLGEFHKAERLLRHFGI